ncbi:DsbA family protein [Halorussus salinisoli]|uniref:DsbA family protein n=1 Tax=Halorussus salinisoli TaxID=2558242 RepID=UPI0010C19A01|nr:DsbA family protein [Halorussus salinisoli]
MVVRNDAEIVSNRRKLLGAAGSAFFASIAGCASVIQETANGPDTETTEASPTTNATPTTTGGQNSSDGNLSDGNVSEPGDAGSGNESESLGRVTIEKPKVSIPKSLVPSDPGQYDYARLGREDADVTATLYGNWKCPYTQEFVVQMMGEVVEKFVKPGDVAVEFRSLSYLNGEPFLGADAPRAARAGLEIWQSAPERYWQYFASVFTNQPPERYEWATADRLVRFAETTKVGNTDALENAMLTGKHREKVRATTDRATELSISTVPRVVAGGEVTAPTVDFSTTKRQLRRAIDG